MLPSLAICSLDENRSTLEENERELVNPSLLSSSMCLDNIHIIQCVNFVFLHTFSVQCLLNTKCLSVFLVLPGLVICSFDEIHSNSEVNERKLVNPSLCISCVSTNHILVSRAFSYT